MVSGQQGRIVALFTYRILSCYYWWSHACILMILQLREVPGLAERMAALMCVDLDRRIGAEEADEQDGDESGSLEHVLQVVEKERARVQERGSDSAAWLELEELGIDDDMLVALDLSANFPVWFFFFFFKRTVDTFRCTGCQFCSFVIYHREKWLCACSHVPHANKRFQLWILAFCVIFECY